MLARKEESATITVGIYEQLLERNFAIRKSQIAQYDFVRNCPVDMYDLNGLQEGEGCGENLERFLEGIFGMKGSHDNMSSLLAASAQCGAHSKCCSQSHCCWCCVLTVVATPNIFGELDIESASGQLFKKPCDKLGPGWQGPPIITEPHKDVRQFFKGW